MIKKFAQFFETESLSGLKIPKVVLPKFEDYGEILRWVYKENVPGSFPYTAGVFPFKREGEDPKRQFAGEGTPERTNRRFHYLSKDDDAKRLSTAFDSVTLIRGRSGLSSGYLRKSWRVWCQYLYIRGYEKAI